MSWKCLVCGCRQCDGTHSSMHSCNQILNTSFVTSDSQRLSNTFDYQPYLFNSNLPITSFATQYSPNHSTWLTDENTSNFQLESVPSTTDKHSPNNSKSQETQTECSRSELVRTRSPDTYVESLEDQTICRPNQLE